MGTERIPSTKKAVEKRERRVVGATEHRKKNSAIVAEEKSLTKRVLKKRGDRKC
jgi:hypothetical protein